MLFSLKNTKKGCKECSISDICLLGDLEILEIFKQEKVKFLFELYENCGLAYKTIVFLPLIQLKERRF